MNVGNSLVMSPSLVTKYLDAAKDIASHAMLLPDGIRFSPKNTRRDWTEEILAEIRGFYRQFTDNGGGTAVNLQGIKFNTNAGGRLPVEPYFSLPPRCDTVRLPSRGERVAELRRTVSFVAARAFRPDVALIATLPPGDELDSTLFTLRRAGCRLVLGLQDAERLLPATALPRVAYA